MLAELIWVAALTVPALAAMGPSDVILAQDADLSAVDADRPEPAVAADLTNNAVGAPAAVAKLAARHGGTEHSRWVAIGCERVAELVRDHNLPPWMTSVAWRESRCIPNTVNINEKTRDESYGLFQINTRGYLWAEARDRCGAREPADLLDAETNVSCAAKLYAAYGYQPWDSGVYFARVP